MHANNSQNLCNDTDDHDNGDGDDDDDDSDFEWSESQTCAVYTQTDGRKKTARHADHFRESHERR